jgi:thiamine transport system permease protein
VNGHSSKFVRTLLALPPLVFLLVVLVAPAVRLMALGWQGEGGEGMTLSALWVPWQDAYLRWRMAWSVIQASVTCVAVLVLGLPVAWVLARFEFAGRTLILRGLMLPFVVPTLVAALGVLALLGPQGLVAHLGGPDLQGTPWLLLYGNLFFNLCVLVLAATQALGQVSASRLGVARSLGCTPWRAFWRVEWPAIVPWLMSALCLVFLYCFSGFGLALVLGGQDYATAEVEIYTLVAHELQLRQASVLAWWMLVLTGLVVLAYGLVEQRLATPQRADRLPRRAPQGVGQWAAVLASVLILVVFCAAPLVAIAWAAILSGAAVPEVLLAQDTLDALWNTVRFSVLALLLATLLGVLHALAARYSLMLRALAFLPFVVSPVVVAFGLLLLYPRWSGSFGLMVAAYALLGYPFVAKSLASALDSLPPSYAQVARSLGASPWRTFWRVTLPLLLPALRRGMAFAAATAVGEFAVTLFLSRPEWATLTTLIYQHLGRPGTSNREAALVLSCVLMLLALAVFLALEWRSDPDSPDA